MNFDSLTREKKIYLNDEKYFFEFLNRNSLHGYLGYLVISNFTTKKNFNLLFS